MSALRVRLRFRLLPVTLLVAALVLTTRLGAIWEGYGGFGTPAAEAAAPAEKAPPEAPAAAAAQTPAAPLALPGDPGMSPAEVELLQKLAARREAIEQRERDLDLREGLVRAAEDKLAGKAAELEAMQTRIEGLIRKHDEQQEAKLASLVSIYEKMKPKEAAQILNGLDMEILIDVLSRMKEMKSAPVLAAMEPEKARAATARLARRDPPLGKSGG